MICPRTSVGCYNTPQCKSAESCVMRLCNPPKQDEKSGMAQSMEHLSGTRADAKMAEFERLLDEYANSIFWPEMASEKRAALIDWVRNNLRIS